MPFIFEPHGGFGSNDPDGKPWPFGYISNDNPRSPVFELSIVLGFPDDILTGVATQMAAASDLMEALDDLLRGIGGEESTDLFCVNARRALAKARGQS